MSSKAAQALLASLPQGVPVLIRRAGYGRWTTAAGNNVQGRALTELNRDNKIELRTYVVKK